MNATSVFGGLMMYVVLVIVGLIGVCVVKRLEHKFNQDLNDLYLKLHDINRRRWK